MNSITGKLVNKGDKYGPFILKETNYIEELGCELKEVIHEPSGAQIIHIANDDPENVFCLSLRTLPDTSNGVAHILEHTVLCGSKKFPVKDPFFSMNRRSLNTYMNALTGPDFTCYPAASQVPKDFYNLLEVYLDAVFHPELKPLSFLQEGHRLEFLEPNDASTPLTFKGIVFNEMKGALSSPISRLWDHMMKKLFPDILYAHNFGGEPLEIPDLTYQGLVDFHQKFYQESRCTFYFYGNLPLEQHLDFLETHTLKGAKKLPPLAPNPLQALFKKPTEDSFGYPIASHEDTKNKSYIALAWLTCPLTNQLDILALQVLDLILMGTDAAPLKIEILKSGLCQNVQTVLEDELSQVPYCLVIEGTEPDQLEPLKKLVFETLTKIANNPIDADLIEGAIHQLEFSRTEINSDYGPFGLSLILKAVPLKNVGASFENSLKIHCQFDALRDKIKNPDYLSSFIKKYFIENPHFISTAMFPDTSLIKKEVEEEQAKLDELKQKLSEDDSTSIIKKSKELKEFQEMSEDQNLEVLPKVTLDDVSRTPRQFELRQEKLGNANAFFHPCFTNGIIYQNVCFKLPHVEFEDLPYTRLFAYLLPHLGSQNKSYIENLKLIQEHTGGVCAFLDSYIPVDNHETFTPYLVFQGKCLFRNFEHLTSIMKGMIEAPNFDDEERLKELLTQLFVEIDHDLKQNSLRYAVNLASSGFYIHSYVSYYWSGIGYYDLIKKITSDIDTEIPKLAKKLTALKEQLIHGVDYDLITTCPENHYSKLAPCLKELAAVSQKPYKPWAPDFSPKPVESQGKVSSSAVFFTSMALKTTGFTDPDCAYLSVASRLLDNTYLHRVIREQGGAYGGGSSNKMSSGKFCFYAYRDPNLASSLIAFRAACEKIASGDFSDQELEEAKLGIIQKLDHPTSPEYRGLSAYGWGLEGKTLDVRTKLREKIIDTSKENIQSAVKKHLLSQMEDAVTVSFGPKAALEKENLKLKETKLHTLKIESV